MFEVEEICITVEGNTIKGQARRPGPESGAYRERPLLILCHGIPAGKLDAVEAPGKSADGGYASLAELCRKEGLPVFNFNFRGTGRSSGNFDLQGWARDLQAVLDYWNDRGQGEDKGFYLWGFSAGAAVSVYAASRDERVKGVALAACPADFQSLFPPADLHKNISRCREIGIIKEGHFPAEPQRWLEGIYALNPINYIDAIAPRPLLIVHGSRDDLISCEHAWRLYERAGPPKQLLIIPDAGHQLRRDMRAVNRCLEWLK